MGRGLDRKKKRVKAKAARRERAQHHHEHKRKKVEPPSPAVAAAAIPIVGKPKIKAPKPVPALKSTEKTQSTKPKARPIDPSTAAALKREEEELKMLERRLGLTGKRKLPKAFDSDGLSYLLGWKDDVDELAGESGMPAPISESDEVGASDEEHENLNEEEEEEADSQVAEEQGENGEADLDEEADDPFEENGGDESETNGAGGQQENELVAASLKGIKMAAKPAAVVGGAAKYVPPALRRPSESEALVQRRVRSALNKLSASNVNSITQEVESIFSSAPRAEVTAAVVHGLVANAAAAFGRAQIAARAALLAALGGSIGGDIVGAVISGIVHRLNSLITSDAVIDVPAAFAPSSATALSLSSASQDATALLSLLSCLLGLSVASARLLFDLATRLSETLSTSPSNVDLLYQLFQYSGFLLRDADATELRAIITDVQQKISTLGSAGEGRVKYLLESLTNLRHNKRALQSDDALEPLKKWLRTRTRKCEVLEGGWSDWLEGGAAKKWVTGPNAKLHDHEADSGGEEEVNELGKEEAALEALARKERMNTPGRRAVFCVLMGSEDFADAVEKLSRMGAKGRAERDIGAVLLHCASREAKFNPFYAHVAAKLCSLRHSYRVTFQFALWDKLKEADSARLPELANLAKLLAHLAGMFALSLSVLRIIEFEPLSARHLLFLRVVFTHLFTSFPEATLLSVLRRLCSAPNTADLREGLLVLFEKGIDPTGLAEDNATKFRKGLRMAKKVLEEAADVEMGEPEDAAEQAEDEDSD